LMPTLAVWAAKPAGSCTRASLPAGGAAGSARSGGALRQGVVEHLLGGPGRLVAELPGVGELVGGELVTQAGQRALDARSHLGVTAGHDLEQLVELRRVVRGHGGVGAVQPRRGRAAELL